MEPQDNNTGNILPDNMPPEESDVRWKRRYENYMKALQRLQKAKEINSPSELEKTGIIQCFEFTHELAWNVMKDFLEYKGNAGTGLWGSRDTVRLAFNRGLITQGAVWIAMIETRNRTVHAYNESILTEDIPKIINQYLPLLETFAENMKQYL